MKTLNKQFHIAANQPVLQGHFPGRPILPGVMLLSFVKETLSQELGQNCRIKKIIRHKFVKPVFPKFTIRVECKLSQVQPESVFSVNCSIFDQNDHLVASGQYNVELLSS